MPPSTLGAKEKAATGPSGGKDDASIGRGVIFPRSISC